MFGVASTKSDLHWNEIIGKQSEDIVTAEWAAHIRASDEEALHKEALIRQEQ